MKTMDEIYNEMRSCFAEETGLEAGAGGDLAVRFYALAAQLHALYIQAEWTKRQCFPQTAVGEYLDQHATLRGVERKAAAAACGVLRFSVSTAAQSDLTIPTGTVCMTAGLVRFETTEDAVLEEGSRFVDVPAAALEVGTGGNVAEGAIRSMVVAPTGVESCTNPSAFSGGTEEEDDESLRIRVLETYHRLSNGANAAFYQQKAMSFDEVASAVVLPRARGVGTVDVVITAQNGVPKEELLGKVQAYFDEVREIAVEVRVLAPETVTVDVSLAVRIADTADADSVLETVKTLLAGHFDGAQLGKDVLLAELGAAVFAVDGVENYAFSAPSSDVAVAETVLPVLGTLTVEVMG